MVFAQKSILVLASFLCYCKVVNKQYLEFILKKLSSFCFNYVKKEERRVKSSLLDDANAIGANQNHDTTQPEAGNLPLMIEHHGHFYNCVQSIIQIINYRQSEVFKDNDSKFYLLVWFFG